MRFKAVHDLTSNLCKAMERIISDRLQWLMEVKTDCTTQRKTVYEKEGAIPIVSSSWDWIYKEDLPTESQL